MSTRFNQQILWPSGSSDTVSGSFSYAGGSNTIYSNWVPLPNVTLVALQLEFSSSLAAPFTGSVSLQYSADEYNAKWNDFGRQFVTRASDDPDSVFVRSGSLGYSGNPSTLWDVETGAAWARVKVTRTAGSGSFKLRGNGKGPQT